MYHLAYGFCLGFRALRHGYLCVFYVIIRFLLCTIGTFCTFPPDLYRSVLESTSVQSRSILESTSIDKLSLGSFLTRLSLSTQTFYRLFSDLLPVIDFLLPFSICVFLCYFCFFTTNSVIKKQILNLCDQEFVEYLLFSVINFIASNPLKWFRSVRCCYECYVSARSWWPSLSGWICGILHGFETEECDFQSYFSLHHPSHIPNGWTSSRIYSHTCPHGQ